MRTINPNIITAQGNNTYRACARATLYKTRAFWTDTTREFTVAQACTYSTNMTSLSMLPETVIYSNTLEKPIGAFVYAFYPKIYQDGNSTPVTITSSYCLPNQRIGLTEYGNTGYTFHINPSSGVIVRTSFSLTSFGSSQASTTFGSGYSVNTTPASITALAYDKIIVFFKKNSGIGVRYYWYNSGWQMHEMPDQFIFPDKAITPYSLLYTAATETATHICVYATNLNNGEVLGRQLSKSVSSSQYNYGWSDIFTAIPTDLGDSKGLTMFRLTQAGLDGVGQPYLVGQFWRTQEMYNGAVYCTRVHSVNGGKDFYYDRNSVFATLPYRFWLVYGGNKIFAVSKNDICEADIIYPLGETSITIERQRMLSVSGQDQELTIAIGNGDNYYTPNNEYILNGNRVKLELGYYTEEGPTYSDYGFYTITAIRRGIRDGSRELAITITHDGMFRSEHMSQPYYTEIESKACLQDPLADLSNLYVAPLSGETDSTITVDFWHSEPHSPDGFPYTLEYPTAIQKITLGTGFVEPHTFSGIHAGCVKIDIGNLPEYKDLPIATATSLELHITYWSSGTGTNDNAYAWLLMEKPSGERYYATGALASTYENTKCTYPEPIAGEDMYVSYQFSGVSAGDKIHSIFVVWNANNSTTMYAERVWINNVTAIFEDGNNSPWAQMTPSGLEVPTFGHPYIMFATKPYSSANFSIEGRFKYISGTTPASGAGAKTAWGVIGLANNAQNYFCARYNKTKASSKFEIVMVKNGVETVLASTTSFDAYGNSIGVHYILFKHENGTLKAWLRKNAYEYNTSNPDASYTWAYTTSMAPWPEYHVGIYGIKRSAAIRIIGFNSSKGTNIGILPGQVDELSDFDSSGRVVIDSYLYSYTSKVTAPSPIRGPFQFRSQSSYGEYWNDGHKYANVDLRIEDYFTVITFLNWNETNYNADNYDMFTGKILASSNGYSHPITSSDWKPFTLSGTTRVSLPTKSFHYMPWKHTRNSGGSVNDRVYITGGLTGVKRVGGDTSQIMHYHGAKAMKFATDRIICSYLSTYSGARDCVISDMIESINARAGTVSSFPNDGAHSSLSLTTTPQDI